MPEFSVDGRVNIVPQPSVIVQSGRVFQSTWRAAGDGPLRILERASDATRGGPMMVAIIAIAFLIAMRKLPVPSASLLLLVSGYVWFGLASLLAFRLYSPDRMLLNSLPAAAVVFLVTTVPSIGTSEGKPWAGKRSAALGMAGGCLLFGIAHGGPVGFSVDANEKRELFEILETLPEQALIAGHPARLDDVPLWSKRRVLISYEMHGPWFRKIWEEGKRRTYASLEACYAVDVEPLVTLREEYGVDFMLLRREDLGLEFALEAGYFEPFGAFIEELTVAPANELIWNRASDETIVDEASGYVLFDLEAVIVESRVGEE